MSMDHGDSGVDFDYALRARLRVAMQTEGLTWSELCREAGLKESDAERAVTLGSDGLPQNLEILQRLSIALGRDLNWLATGVSSGPNGFRQPLLERVRQLVWEYIYKSNIPKLERKPLLTAVDKLIQNLPCSTERAAYRLGVPRTWKDVAVFHERLRRETATDSAGDRV